MKTSEKEILKAIEENFGHNNYESDDFRLGKIRAITPKPALSPVMGQPVAGTYVGEVSFKLIRNLNMGTKANVSLPVAIGSPFSSLGGYRRIINQILPSGVTFESYGEDVNSNLITFTYTTGSGLETISITSDYYDVITMLKGLHNVKALATAVSITTPDDSTLISQFVNTAILPFSESWLTKIDKDQRSIKIAAGQFNKNVFDLNVPLALSPNQGLALSLPPIVNADPTIGDTYNIQMYFNTIEKF